jgi:hypothetical protein
MAETHTFDLLVFLRHSRNTTSMAAPRGKPALLPCAFWPTGCGKRVGVFSTGVLGADKRVYQR